MKGDKYLMKVTVPIVDIVLSLSEAIDSISPAICDHQKQVAYISYYISNALNFSPSKKKEVLIAGALHDIGALSINEKKSMLNFEYQDKKNGHSEKGYMLLSLYKPFLNVAKYVRYHHVSWKYGHVVSNFKEKIPLESYILNLSDKISILINPEENILLQAEKIRKRIYELSGEAFNPDVVDAFMEVSKKESFWFDIKYNNFYSELEDIEDDYDILSEDDLSELIKLFSRMIDFRSKFTYSHSSGVAASSKMIAKIMGFSEKDCTIMELAGYVHDLGKIAVPIEILEKQGKLTEEEYDIVKIHPYYTDKILKKVKAFDTIREWGALHHERLDGNGYPFHLKGDQISLGSRIMAVADIFTALKEDRSYRKGMDRKKTMGIIEDMSGSALDKNVVKKLKENYDIVNNERIRAQNITREEYKNINNDYDTEG